MTVHFIGAGPGAADLLTIRATRLLAASPVCLYAGTYLDAAVLEHCPDGARLVDTQDLDLDGITAERFDLVTMAVPEADLAATVEDIARDCVKLGPADARYKKTVYNAALEMQGLGAAFRYQSHMNGMARWARALGEG